MKARCECTTPVLQRSGACYSFSWHEWRVLSCKASPHTASAFGVFWVCVNIEALLGSLPSLSQSWSNREYFSGPCLNFPGYFCENGRKEPCPAGTFLWKYGEHSRDSCTPCKVLLALQGTTCLNFRVHLVLTLPTTAWFCTFVCMAVVVRGSGTRGGVLRLLSVVHRQFLLQQQCAITSRKFTLLVAWTWFEDA